MIILYSDVDPLLKYSPVTLHFSSLLHSRLIVSSRNVIVGMSVATLLLLLEFLMKTLNKTVVVMVQLFVV